MLHSVNKNKHRQQYSLAPLPVVSYETCNYGYKHFRSGDFDLSDQAASRTAISKHLHQMGNI